MCVHALSININCLQITCDLISSASLFELETAKVFIFLNTE